MSISGLETKVYIVYCYTLYWRWKQWIHNQRSREFAGKS